MIRNTAGYWLEGVDSLAGFMEIARSEALAGIEAGDGGPFGAVIVRDKEVIASAHNTVLKDNDSTAHGEINAIRKAEKILGTYDLTGCEIYTTGYPCPMCLGAILWARISKVYYGCSPEDAAGIGFDDSFFYEVMSSGGSKGPVQFVQFENEECREVFNKWMEKSDRVRY